MNTINLDAYFVTIQKKTGKTLSDFRQLAEQKGYLEDGRLDPAIKASVIFDWLKDEFNLGRGHGMAIYHSLKSE